MLRVDFFGDEEPGKRESISLTLDFLGCIAGGNFIQRGLVQKRKEFISRNESLSLSGIFSIDKEK